MNTQVATVKNQILYGRKLRARAQGMDIAHFAAVDWLDLYANNLTPELAERWEKMQGEFVLIMNASSVGSAWAPGWDEDRFRTAMVEARDAADLPEHAGQAVRQFCDAFRAVASAYGSENVQEALTQLRLGHALQVLPAGA